MDVTLPNGKIIQGVPDGTPKDVIKQKAISNGLATENDFAPKEASMMDKAIGTGEALLTAATGAGATMLGGLYGISEALDPTETEGAGARGVKAVQDALTYQPRGKEAAKQLKAVGEFAKPFTGGVERLESDLGEGTLELTGSAELATLAHTLPTFMLELIGVKGGKSGINAVKNNKKIMEGVKPAKQLVERLENKGIVIENLQPETIKRIPSNLPVLARKGKAVDNIAEDIMGAEIAAGAKDAALAPFKAKKGRDGRFKLEPDRLAEQAIKQGYEPGFVQSMKVASPDTKAAMRKMNENMKRIRSDETLASKIRPSNIAGDAVTERIKVIRDKANSARDTLNDLAENVLPGKQVDAKPIVQQFKKSLDDLGVKAVNKDGSLDFDFSNSIIEADPGSQRLIKQSFKIMNKSGPVDAIQVHNLKKKLDALIDFNKVTKGGLPESGRNVLKDLRRAANESIRKVDPKYAEVNDVLSESLKSLDDFQGFIGKKIPMFQEGANKAIGTDMRALLSNQKRRVALENSLKNIDELARKYGYTKQDDVEQLVRMANRLDRRFGAVAETSFQGNIDSALQNAARQIATGDVQGAAVNMLAEGALKRINKLRSVDDVHAFRAVDDLLSR